MKPPIFKQPHEFEVPQEPPKKQARTRQREEKKEQNFMAQGPQP